MLGAAARRLLILFGFTAGLTLVSSVALGALVGASPRRSLSAGFYLAGSLLLLAGFFVGNRGVLRADSASDDRGPLSFLGVRRVRSATGVERRETAATSAIVIALGVSLLIVGVLADNENELI